MTSSQNCLPAIAGNWAAITCNSRRRFARSPIVMVVAILLVFIMLAFQFKSASLPLLIFLTQPLSLVAGLFALWITEHRAQRVELHGGHPAHRPGHEERHPAGGVHPAAAQEGMELQPALLLAGPHQVSADPHDEPGGHSRPVPAGPGHRSGAQMQQPLAIMVIGGLTANMLFTRMIIPVGYLLYAQREEVGSRK